METDAEATEVAVAEIVEDTDEEIEVAEEATEENAHPTEKAEVDAHLVDTAENAHHQAEKIAEVEADTVEILLVVDEAESDDEVIRNILNAVKNTYIRIGIFLRGINIF